MEGCLQLTHKSAAQFEVKCEFKVQNNSIFKLLLSEGGNGEHF